MPLNAAFVHPANVTKIRSLKNKLADYLNILPNGTDADTRYQYSSYKQGWCR